MKTTHTHRGNCQACGALQAVDNIKGTIAKHGYEVARFGCFVGTCPGSDKKPAQHDTSFTRHIMTVCEEHAVEMTRIAGLYSTRELMLTCYATTRYDRKLLKHVAVKLPLIGCTDAMIVREYTGAVRSYMSIAERDRSHIEFLKRDILPLLGTALIAVAKKIPPRVFVAGETVKLNGHDFVLDSPRYSYSGTGIKFWKGHYSSDDTRHYTPSIRQLRSENK